MTQAILRDALDHLAGNGDKLELWLRDDDAVTPSAPLDRLLALTGTYDIPVTLAVIPEETGIPLVERLTYAPQASVAVHGWSHRSHAASGEKKQELDAHRPAEVVLTELRQGFDKLKTLHAERFVPMLVPPWNRIAPALTPQLQTLGFTSLSVFGKERLDTPLPLVNTHVDVMDWHGTRGGRPAAVLFSELAGWIKRADRPPVIGVLTHHLVHDEAVWEFLDTLFALTASHAGCEWVQPGRI